MSGAEEDGPLVSAARRGSEEAWRRLYRLHHRRLVLWLATVATGDVAAGAEDIAAEAWIVAAGKIGEFQGSDHDFGGWLVAISRNLVANQVRRSGRRRTDPTGTTPDGVDRVPDPAASVSGEAWTREVLRRLPRRQAEVIACMDVVGLDTAATARALGMSVTAVRVARHRGLGALRKALADGSLPER